MQGIFVQDKEIVMVKKAKRLATVSNITAKRIENALKDAAAQRQKRERREHENIQIVVGKHSGCDGNIIYGSEFVLGVSRPEVRFGGKNPMREKAKCSCDTCGQLFDPDFPPYRKKIEEHRARD